jgi:protein arginine kinase activator
MKLKQCSLCNKYTDAPYKLTEAQADGSAKSFYACPACAEARLGGSAIDLSRVSTAEELLDLILKAELPPRATPPCGCGLTEAEFDRDGRFGCAACYVHFSAKMTELVFPYHKAQDHVGKKPKAHWLDPVLSDPVAKQKLLKLRYAKALELEQYERAAEIKGELDELTSRTPPQTSAGQ